MNTSETPNSLLCFGMGFSGKALAQRLLDEGWRVSGTSRSAQGCAALAEHGVMPWQFDGSAPLPAEAFDGVTHILSSVPPAREDNPGHDAVLALHRAQILACAPLWIGYLSTTGVYGDHQGGWVDETTPTSPDVTRSAARVQAEREWQALTPSAHVFRLAGIYGPGRNAVEQVRRGTARCIIKENQWFGRIHVEDIAQVVHASIVRPRPGAIYNVCDDLPTPPQEPIRYAAELLGVEPPPAIPFDSAELSPMARSFYADSRRVRNTLIKQELGVQLRYPTYREGLAAVLSKD